MVYVIQVCRQLASRMRRELQFHPEVTGRQGRRHMQLLDDLKEKGGHWEWKEEALDRTVWGSDFGIGYVNV
jgi:hypothetical protein